MYSTSPGFYSYRNINSGTWFIQELCKKLELHHESMNLLSILTLVIGSVAYGYQAETSDADTNAAKQLPHINSQLTKILHFGPIPDVSEEQKDEGEQREFTCDITRHYMWISIIFLIALCYALLVNYFVSRKE